MRSEQIRSPLLPGGDLVSALFDREVMALADRGGASNLIGDRWADLAAAHAATWAASGRLIETGDHDAAPIVRVDRLDANPRIAAAASRRSMQNPDLLLIGQQGERHVVQAADAKFSVETARSKQVSPEVVVGLLGLRDLLPDLLPDLEDAVHIEPGIFLCPDYPLTHLMLQSEQRLRRGILRTTVRPWEVALVPVSAASFWDGVDGASLIAPLAAVDEVPVRPDESLLAGVYYFRLARAAVGFWLDATKPLLLCNDVVRVEEPAVLAETERRASRSDSAIELIRQWDADVQTVRNQRAAVEQVAGLPIPGRELRPMATRIAEGLGAEPPSANQVRRRLGSWYRGELRDQVGPIMPPVTDLQAELRRVAAAGREVAPRLEEELERVVRELIAEGNGRDESAEESNAEPD
jgi:hypothetical protein